MKTLNSPTTYRTNNVNYPRLYKGEVNVIEQSGSYRTIEYDKEVLEANDVYQEHPVMYRYRVKQRKYPILGWIDISIECVSIAAYQWISAACLGSKLNVDWGNTNLEF